MLFSFFRSKLLIVAVLATRSAFLASLQQRISYSTSCCFLRLHTEHCSTRTDDVITKHGIAKTHLALWGFHRHTRWRSVLDEEDQIRARRWTKPTYCVLERSRRLDLFPTWPRLRARLMCCRLKFLNILQKINISTSPHYILRDPFFLNRKRVEVGTHLS